jgi:hypothetical protein
MNPAMFWAYLYGVTFLVVLPIVCKNLMFSIYFLQTVEQKDTLQESMTHENDRRIKEGRRYLKQRPARADDNDGSKWTKGEVDVLFTIVTTSRNRNRSNRYQPQYLTQTLARLLELLDHKQHKLTSRVAICNVDHDPTSYGEYWWVQNITRGLTITFQKQNKRSLSILHPVEKEKQDYVFCLNRSQSVDAKYVLLLEDDALPLRDFLTVLDHLLYSQLRVIRHRDEHYIRSKPWAFVKLYHPQRLQGYFSLERERLLELWATGSLIGMVLMLVYTHIFPRKNKVLSWMSFSIYVMMLVMAVGRTNIQDLRRYFAPSLYSLVPAPDCCTPAMLYPREQISHIVQYMDNMECTLGFAKDSVLTQYRTEKAIQAFLVQPNLIQHIGLYSALRNIITDPFAV